MTHLRFAALTLAALGLAACNDGQGSSTTAQSLGQACAVDGDCGSVEQCLHNICVPKVDAGVVDWCKDNSGCGAGQVCEHGVCLPHQIADGGVTLCFDDADCSGGDHCVVGVCLPSTVPTPPPLPPLPGPMTGIGQPCSTSADCTNNLQCGFGVCLPIDTCVTAADCSNGQKQCIKGICI